MGFCSAGHKVATKFKYLLHGFLKLRKQTLWHLLNKYGISGSYFNETFFTVLFLSHLRDFIDLLSDSSEGDFDTETQEAIQASLQDGNPSSSDTRYM